MKFNLTFLSEKNRKAVTLAVMSFVAISLGSCKNDDVVNVPDQSAVNVTNASPTRNSVDFYLDNQKVNKNAAIVTGNNTGYWLAFTGSRTATVTASGNSTSILTQKINLQSGRYHSVFIVDSAANALSFLTIRDEWSTSVPQDKAQIRFINLTPDAPNYTLEYVGDATEFANRAYREYTAFKAVPAKTGITLRLKNTSTNTIVDSLTNVEFKSQEIYTVWARSKGTTPVDSVKRIKITRLTKSF